MVCESELTVKQIALRILSLQTYASWKIDDNLLGKEITTPFALLIKVGCEIVSKSDKNS